MRYSAENERFVSQLGLGADVFTQPKVLIELPEGQETRSEALHAFMLTANLCVRMFRQVYLRARDVDLPANAWTVPKVSDLSEPLSGISEGTVRVYSGEAVDIAIGIGHPPKTSAGRTTWIDFSGWQAALDCSTSGRAKEGVFGALFAACYGSAQAFLHAVALVGGNKPLIKPFNLSLLDYTFAGPNGCHPRATDIGTVHLVGVGAVGCAAVYALAAIPELSGTLHLLDNDAVDDTNLQRYILMRRGDVGRNKPQVALEALSGTLINAMPHDMTLEAFVNSQGSAIDLLLTPVDSPEGRRALARHLPRSVLNAATGSSTVTVSRHGFGDGTACLHCLYLPEAGEVTNEQRLARDLGITEAEVKALIISNEGVKDALVRRIELHKGVAIGTFQAWGGQPIQSFYQRAICGTASVNTGIIPITAPLSFISAAAGVLLASELLKSRNPDLRRYALDNYFRLDTLYTPNPAVRSRKPADSSGRCICADAEYVEVYRRRYGQERQELPRPSASAEYALS